MTTSQSIQSIFDAAFVTRGMIQLPENEGLDGSSFGIDGALVSHTHERVYGKYAGQAFYTDGTDDVVTFTANPIISTANLTGYGGFTLAFAVRTRSFAADQFIYQESSSTANNPLTWIKLKSTTGHIEFFDRNGSGINSTKDFEEGPALNEWSLYVMTRTADGDLALYDEKNQSLGGGPTDVRLASTDLITWGARMLGGTAQNYFDGQLGALVAANVVFTEDQRQELINALAPVVSTTLPQSERDAIAATCATAVRTELATELARIDVDISSRLATTGYTAPLDAAATSNAIGLQALANILA